VDAQSLPIVALYPTALTGEDRSVVEGSVIQLRCTAESTTIDTPPTITWTRDSAEISDDPPHVRLRTSSDGGGGVTSVLTIDGFVFSDDGSYKCVASDSRGNTTGDVMAELRAVSSTKAGTLTLLRQPSSREDDSFIDNRTSVILGSTLNSLLVCIVEHLNHRTAPTPSIVWIRNGIQVDDTDTRITVTNAETAENGRLESTLRIDDFRVNDTGVYQCISIDDMAFSGEIITSTPHQLDAGDTVILERVSPEVIVVATPDILVIQVEASGAYSQLAWQAPLSPPSGYFLDFYETYVREETSEADLGVYTVDADALRVEFTVTPYISPTTTSDEAPVIFVREGESVDVTCSASGNPTPTITWQVGDSPAPFNKSDNITDFEVTEENGTMPSEFMEGSVNSTLHVAAASFPEDNGVLICVGSNSYRGVDSASNASFELLVLVVPEVELVPSLARININGSQTLLCNVTRSNPSNHTYSWAFDDGSGVPVDLGETSNVLDLTPVQETDFGTYRCSVTNFAGTGISGPAIVEEELDLSVDGGIQRPIPGQTLSFTCVTWSGILIWSNDIFRNDLTFVGLLDDVNATRLDPVTGGVATLVGETGLILTSVLTFDSLIRELNETEVVCTDSDGDNNRTRIIMAGWS
jgi:hypothetical protein